MKKFFIIFILFIITINIYSDNKSEAEKYFNIAIQYYLEGDLDNAINVLTRALQKDKDNVRFAALYDIILEEKQKLKIIRLDTNYLNNAGNNFDYKKLLKDIKTYLDKKSDRQNQRYLNLINSLSKETIAIRDYQEVIDKRIKEQENIILVKDKQIKIITIFILIFLILFFILCIIFFIFYKKFKKTEESIKVLSLKQSENQAIILKLKEQLKLEEKST